ncbi:hypothetical protein N4X08_004164 [Salmonella enterica]|nr:hypothetical protein [Salmonella enterica]
MPSQEHKREIFKKHSKAVFSKADIQHAHDYFNMIHEMMIKKIEMADERYDKQIKTAKTKQEKEYAERLLHLEHLIAGGLEDALKQERKIWKDFQKYHIG